VDIFSICYKTLLQGLSKNKAKEQHVCYTDVSKASNTVVVKVASNTVVVKVAF
jgi:hypothetical protein